MDSSPPDRARVRLFFNLADTQPDSVGRSSSPHDRQLAAARSTLPVMRSQHQQQQQDILSYWRGWETDVVLGAVENPDPLEDDAEDESFLGGDFSLSELLNALPSDRIQDGRCDLRDLPSLAAVCATPCPELSSAPSARAQKVCDLLAEGADPRERDPVFGRNPLHWACIYADLNVVRIIVGAMKSNASASSGSLQQPPVSLATDINYPDINGLTPLQAVLELRDTNRQEHADIVEYLIAQGADLACLPRRGAELLFADFLTVDIARAVLATGVPVDVRDAVECTPLLRVVLAGNLPLVKFFLDQGADPRQRIFFGGALLNHYGISTEVAALLIQRGADPDLGDDLGMTPLMFACQDKNLSLIRLLIRHGASVRARSADGMRVVEYAPDEETLRFLQTEAGLAPGTRLADD